MRGKQPAEPEYFHIQHHESRFDQTRDSDCCKSGNTNQCGFGKFTLLFIIIARLSLVKERKVNSEGVCLYVFLFKEENSRSDTLQSNGWSLSSCLTKSSLVGQSLVLFSWRETLLNLLLLGAGHLQT